MDAGLERRWDGDVETAWTQFRRRLADRLAGLPEDELLLVELAGESGSGTRPYCQALAGEGTLRIEAVSNTYLAPAHRLAAAQEEALERIGFDRPEAEDWAEGETNFFTTLEQREADLAAVMIVRAMREVFSVIHPVWLDAGGLEPTALGEEQPPVAAPRPDVPLTPRSVEEVREAVDAAVAGLYDAAPEWDDDGDLPLPTEHHVVWVSVNGANPRILLHCCLLVDVTDTAAALREVNRLNRQEFGLTFVLRDDKISVCREIAVHVVLPQALQEEAERLLGQVDGWAAELADTLAPQREERPTRHSRFGTAYAVMVELERAQRESVGPATMAHLPPRHRPAAQGHPRHRAAATRGAGQGPPREGGGPQPRRAGGPQPPGLHARPHRADAGGAAARRRCAGAQGAARPAGAVRRGRGGDLQVSAFRPRRSAGGGGVGAWCD